MSRLEENSGAGTETDLAGPSEAEELLVREFNRLPTWVKKEFQALASILRFPEELNATYGDVQEDLFFGRGTSAMARFILDHYTDKGELPELTSIEKHVRAIYSAEDADRYLRFLRTSPTFCPHHVTHDLVWFAHERRFCRRFSDAFEDLREQEFSWREFQDYFFRAADLEDLQYDTCFSRLLALLCRSLLARFSEDRPPEPWSRAVQREHGLEDAFAARTLHKIALEQLLAWEEDGNAFVAPAQYVEFFKGEN